MRRLIIKKKPVEGDLIRINEVMLKVKEPINEDTYLLLETQEDDVAEALTDARSYWYETEPT